MKDLKTPGQSTKQDRPEMPGRNSGQPGASPQLGQGQEGVQAPVLQASGASVTPAMDPGSSLLEEEPNQGEGQSAENVCFDDDLYDESLISDATAKCGVCVPPSPWHSNADSMDILYYGLSPAHPSMAQQSTSNAPFNPFCAVSSETPASSDPVFVPPAPPVAAVSPFAMPSVPPPPSSATVSGPRSVGHTKQWYSKEEYQGLEDKFKNLRTNMVSLIATAQKEIQHYQKTNEELRRKIEGSGSSTPPERVQPSPDGKVQSRSDGASGASISQSAVATQTSEAKIPRMQPRTANKRIQTSNSKVVDRRQQTSPVKSTTVGLQTEFAKEVHVDTAVQTQTVIDETCCQQTQVEAVTSLGGQRQTDSLTSTLFKNPVQTDSVTSMVQTISLTTTTLDKPIQTDSLKCVDEETQTVSPTNTFVGKIVQAECGLRSVDEEVQTDSQTSTLCDKFIQTDSEEMDGISSDNAAHEDAVDEMIDHEQRCAQSVQQGMPLQRGAEHVPEHADYQAEDTTTCNTGESPHQIVASSEDSLFLSDSDSSEPQPVLLSQPDLMKEVQMNHKEFIEEDNDESCDMESVKPDRTIHVESQTVAETEQNYEGDSTLPLSEEFSGGTENNQVETEQSYEGDSVLPLSEEFSGGTENNQVDTERNCEGDSVLPLSEEFSGGAENNQVQTEQNDEGDSTLPLSEECSGGSENNQVETEQSLLFSEEVSGTENNPIETEQSYEGDSTLMFSEEVSGTEKSQSILTEDMYRVGHSCDAASRELPPDVCEVEEKATAAAEHDKHIQSDFDKVYLAEVSNSETGKKRQRSRSLQSESKGSKRKLSVSSLDNGTIEVAVDEKSTEELDASAMVVPVEESAAKRMRRVSSEEGYGSAHGDRNSALCQDGGHAQRIPSASKSPSGHWAWGRYKDVRGDAWKRKLLLWPSYAHRIVSRKEEIDALFSGEESAKVYDHSEAVYSSLEEEPLSPEHHDTECFYSPSDAHQGRRYPKTVRSRGKSIMNHQEEDSLEHEHEEGGDAVFGASLPDCEKQADGVEFDLERDDASLKSGPTQRVKQGHAAECNSAGSNVNINASQSALGKSSGVSDSDSVEVEVDNIPLKANPPEYGETTSAVTASGADHKKKKRQKKKSDKHTVQDQDKKKDKKKKGGKKLRDCSSVKEHSKSKSVQKKSKSSRKQSDASVSLLDSKENDNPLGKDSEHVFMVDNIIMEPAKELAEVATKPRLFSSGEALEDSRTSALFQSEASSEDMHTSHSVHPCGAFDEKKHQLSESWEDREAFGKDAGQTSFEPEERVDSLTVNNEEEEVSGRCIVDTSREEKKEIGKGLLSVHQDNESESENSLIDVDCVQGSKVDENVSVVGQKATDIIGSLNSVDNSKEKREVVSDEGDQDDSDFSIHTDDSDSEEWPLKVPSKNLPNAKSTEAELTVGTAASDTDSTKDSYGDNSTGFCQETSAMDFTADGSRNLDDKTDAQGSPCQKTVSFMSPDSSEKSVREIDELKTKEKKQSTAASSVFVVKRVEGNQVEDPSRTVSCAEDSQTSTFNATKAGVRLPGPRTRQSSALTDRRTGERKETEVISLFASYDKSSSPSHQQKKEGQAARDGLAGKTSPPLQSDEKGNNDTSKDRKQEDQSKTGEASSEGGIPDKETAQTDETMGVSGMPTTPVRFHQLPVTPKKSWINRSKMASKGETGACRDLISPSSIWSPDKTSFSIISNRQPISSDTFNDMLGLPNSNAASSEENIATGISPVRSFSGGVSAHRQSSSGRRISQHTDSKAHKIKRALKYPPGSQTLPGIPEDRDVAASNKPTQAVFSQISEAEIHKERQMGDEPGDVGVGIEVGQPPAKHTSESCEDITPLFSYPSAAGRDSSARRFPYKHKPLHWPPSSSSSATSVSASRSSSATSTSSSLSLAKENIMQTVQAVSCVENEREPSLSGKGDPAVPACTDSSQEEKTRSRSEGGNENAEQLHSEHSVKTQQRLHDKCERDAGVLKENGDNSRKGKVGVSGDHVQENTNPFYFDPQEENASCADDRVKVDESQAKKIDDTQSALSFALLSPTPGQSGEASHMSPLERDHEVSSSSGEATVAVATAGRADLEEGEINSVSSVPHPPSAAFMSPAGKVSSTTLHITEQSLEEGEIRSDDGEICHEEKRPTCDIVLTDMHCGDDFADNASFRDLREERTLKRPRSPDALQSMTSSRSKRVRNTTDRDTRDPESYREDHRFPSKSTVENSGSGEGNAKERTSKELLPANAGHGDDKEMKEADKQVLQKRNRSRVALEKVRREIVGHTEEDGESPNLSRFTIPKKNRSSVRIRTENRKKGERRSSSENKGTSFTSSTSRVKERDIPKDLSRRSRYSSATENKCSQRSGKEDHLRTSERQPRKRCSSSGDQHGKHGNEDSMHSSKARRRQRSCSYDKDAYAEMKDSSRYSRHSSLSENETGRHNTEKENVHSSNPRRRQSSCSFEKDDCIEPKDISRCSRRSSLTEDQHSKGSRKKEAVHTSDTHLSKDHANNEPMNTSRHSKCSSLIDSQHSGHDKKEGTGQASDTHLSKDDANNEPMNTSRHSKCSSLIDSQHSGHDKKEGTGQASSMQRRQNTGPTEEDAKVEPMDTAQCVKSSSLTENQQGEDNRKEEIVQTSSTISRQNSCPSEEDADVSVVSDGDADSDGSSDPGANLLLEGSQRTRGFIYYRDPLKPRPEREIHYDVEDKSDEEGSEEDDGDDSQSDETDDHDEDGSDEDDYDDESRQDDGSGGSDDEERESSEEDSEEQHGDDDKSDDNEGNSDHRNQQAHDDEHGCETPSMKQAPRTIEANKYETCNKFVIKHGLTAEEAGTLKTHSKESFGPMHGNNGADLCDDEKVSGFETPTERILDSREMSMDCLSLQPTDEGEGSLMGDLNLFATEEAENATLERESPVKPSRPQRKEGLLRHSRDCNSGLQPAAEGQKELAPVSTNTTRCEAKHLERKTVCTICAGLCCGKPTKDTPPSCHADTGKCEDGRGSRCLQTERKSSDPKVGSSCPRCCCSSDQALKKQRSRTRSSGSRSHSRGASHDSRDRSRSACSSRGDKSRSRDRNRPSRDRSYSQDRNHPRRERSFSFSRFKENHRPPKRSWHSSGQALSERSSRHPSPSPCGSHQRDANRGRKCDPVSPADRRNEPRPPGRCRHEERPSKRKVKRPPWHMSKTCTRRDDRDRSYRRAGSEERHWSTKNR